VHEENERGEIVRERERARERESERANERERVRERARERERERKRKREREGGAKATLHCILDETLYTRIGVIIVLITAIIIIITYIINEWSDIYMRSVCECHYYIVAYVLSSRVMNHRSPPRCVMVSLFL